MKEETVEEEYDDDEDDENIQAPEDWGLEDDVSAIVIDGGSGM